MAENTTYKGSIAYSGNFTVQSNAPLDDRIVVDSKDKLLQYDNYSYNGMLVVVLNDNSLWILVDKSRQSNPDFSGWRKIETTGGTAVIIPGKNISVYGDGSINATGYTQDPTNNIVSIDNSRTLWANEIVSGNSPLDPEHTLSKKANTSSLIEDELVASRLFNVLSEKVSSARVNAFEKVVTSGKSIQVLSSEHGCGLWPSVTVYFNNQVVFPDISNTNGDLTITWSVNISTISPLRLIIIGKL